MNTEDYQELNEYLNDMFLKLEKNDYFFLENLEMISYLNARYCELISKYDLEQDSIDRNLTYDDVYKLALEIIESINLEYAEKFKKIIQTGELDFDYEEKYFDSHMLTKVTEDDNNIEIINLINLKRKYNYDEVKILVHEFMHYTNADKRTIKRYILGEYLSIVGEMYAESYMRNKGIDVPEINSNTRLKTTYDRCADLSWVVDVLVAYQKIGNINENSIPFILENVVDIDKDAFEDECQRLLHYFKENENRVNPDRPELKTECDYLFSLTCKYLIGTLLSFYTMKNCKMEDIVNMNNHINDDDDTFIIDTLQKAGIDLENDETIDELFNCIEEYLEKTKNKQR